MNVQAFIDNISFPRTLEELEWFADEFNVEQILTVDETEWTAPKWTVQGDIVFFFHAKTAIQKITMLETKLRQERTVLSNEKYRCLYDALQRARGLYKAYGGKIFAIGRISGRTIYDPQEEDEIFHWASRFYAPIDKIYVLEYPVDIDEFSDFLSISTRGAITPVVGSDFDRLKEIIASKNETPDYFRESSATPLPLQKINAENWLDVTHEYRRLFTLEIQFRRFYVDYLLRELGDQKTFYSECACYKEGMCTGYVDNVVLLHKKWCSVEVKLNAATEAHLFDQLRKYCGVEKMIAREGRKLLAERIVQTKVIIIDTEKVYLYDNNASEMKEIIHLDELKTKEDIQLFRQKLDALENENG